ncbi:MAG TPA: dihydrofolate reductase [Bacteroidia bacterium]|nr:dihydrofolate reductase [Bacteroidota bacterium]HRC32734.1 dihydrofolate reductase [Bacteroidia bacterium]
MYTHHSNISLVVAVSKNLAIGKNNALLWKLSDDLKLFKKITSNATVIMGRKTFDSIGKPLPNRRNIIISRNQDFEASGCEVFDTLAHALEACHTDKEVFVVGGAQIYNVALPLAHKIYITKVDATFDDADTFFPAFNMNNWNIITEQKYSANEKNEYDFTFYELERK